MKTDHNVPVHVKAFKAQTAPTGPSGSFCELHPQLNLGSLQQELMRKQAAREGRVDVYQID